MYTKLFSSITDSTIWAEEDHTRLVWITMLAMADKNGHVAASVPGLASRARVSLEKTIKALERLSSPDEWSRSKEFDGRRIEEQDGGWLIINYTKYAKIRDEEQRKEYMRNYMRKRRGKQSVSKVSSVNLSKPGLAHTDTDTDTEAYTDLKPTPTSEDSRVKLTVNKFSNKEDTGDLEETVREVASIHPRIQDPIHLTQEISHAIAEAVARDGRDLVYAGTKSMAEQVAKWPKAELRFIPSASRYFRESQYLKDPGEWERRNGKGETQFQRINEARKGLIAKYMREANANE